MAIRQNRNKINSEEVQGKDSYVIIMRPTVAEVKIWQKEAREITKKRKEKEIQAKKDEIEAKKAVNKEFDAEKELQNLEAELEEGDIVMQMSSDRLATHVVDWNWVDDNGNNLDKPFNNVEVFDNLTDDEFRFLSMCLLGDTDARKNLKTA